jgi:hypothetical protein
MIQQHCIHSSTFSSLIPQTTHSNTTPSSLIFLHNEPKSPLLVRKQRERVILEVSHHTSGVVKPCIQRDSTLRFYSKRPSLCITRQLEFGVFGLKSKKNQQIRQNDHKQHATSASEACCVVPAMAFSKSTEYALADRPISSRYTGLLISAGRRKNGLCCCELFCRAPGLRGRCSGWIGSFHRLNISPLISQVESQIPIAFGEHSCNVNLGSFGPFPLGLKSLLKKWGAMAVESGGVGGAPTLYIPGCGWISPVRDSTRFY